MADRSLQALSPRLRACGLDLLRFNFPYRAKASRRPDPMPVLQAAFVETAERGRREHAPRRLILGGRSMGGRVATHLASDGYGCDALLLFAYPLHPAGQPGKLRLAHLERIGVPTLCFNGTHDELCRQDLMQPVVESLKSPWRMHWLQGADHSFHVRKASGRNDSQVLDEVQQEIRGWLDGL